MQHSIQKTETNSMSERIDSGTIVWEILLFCNSILCPNREVESLTMTVTLVHLDSDIKVSQVEFGHHHSSSSDSMT